MVKEWNRRQRTNLLRSYKPYAKQLEFHNSPARETLFMAGNQLGKCRTYFDKVPHPDGSVSCIGELFDRGMAFDVLAWDGGATVAAPASHVIKKPAGMCAEVLLSTGETFKASLQHVLLTRSGWMPLERLLLSVPALPASSSAPGLTVRAEGEGHLIEKPLGSLAGYSGGSRLCGEQLRRATADVQDDRPQPFDVPPHNPAMLPSGFLGQTDTNICQSEPARPSSWCDLPLTLARSAVSLSQAAYMRAQSQTGKRLTLLPLRAALTSLLRSVAAICRRQYSKNARALVSPYQNDVEILAYRLIGVYDLYDMTVPIWHNYIADGVVHHNTVAGAAETAMHLTGQYPAWWQGRRFDKAITAIAGSESYELTRDGVQRLLMGPPANEDDWGTGFIPKAAIVDRTRRSGVSNALDSVAVKHTSGGVSTLLFKAYEQGRGKWQANTVDLIWFDEEPPEDVYFEGITRTNATGGPIKVTFTPLKGMSSVVARYLLEESLDRAVVRMTIEDAEHYTPEQRAKIIASYPPHEREARTKGVPSLGSGRIFPIEESEIICQPLDIPKIWPQIIGIDFGWDHPFAACRMAWDRDSDCIYVIGEYRQREASPIIHAAAIKPWGEWIPVAWPHDGLQHDKGSGEQLAAQYRAQGLNLTPERATFDDETNGVEAGVSDMLQRMQTGRWKVFATCQSWLEEFRLYHRDDGKIVKERDDLISASRYGLMMKRFAEVKSSKEPKFERRKIV